LLTLPEVTVEFKPIDWTGLSNRFMNKGELESLCELVRLAKPKTVIEFGINTGRTAKAILREVEGIEKYVGVDVLPGYVTMKQVQRKEVPIVAGELVKDDPRVQLIVTKTGSHELETSQLPKADVVFIDGDHSYEGVAKDTKLARAIIRKGGFIIWHDYNDVRDRRGQAVVDVAEFLHEEAAKGHNIIHVADTWIAYEVA
jgi:predicted O-methyltransferase YrrM